MSAVFMRSIDYWFQIMHYRYNTTPIPNDIYIYYLHQRTKLISFERHILLYDRGWIHYFGGRTAVKPISL